MKGDKRIEDSEVIDPIEAIKNKIKVKGYDVPLITDDFTWKILLDQNVLTGPEIGKIRSAILTATSASQPQGATFAASHVVRLPTEFPESLGSRHPEGTIHASTIVSSSDLDEKEQLKLWFEASLAGEQYFELEKPTPDGREAHSSWKFIDYKDAIEGLDYKVWDVENSTSETVHVILQDINGKRRRISGRADFLITSSDVESQGTALPFTLCVVEIQSKPDEVDCEFQLKSYLFIMMNLYGFARLTGILVYNNGRCRAYCAQRSRDDAAMYEENDTFYLCQIAEILPKLLKF